MDFNISGVRSGDYLELELDVVLPVDVGPGGDAQVMLVEHDDLETAWVASAPLTSSGESRYRMPPVALPGQRVLEISAVIFGNDPAASLRLQRGTHFKDACFIVPDTDGPVVTGPAALEARQQLVQAREALLTAPVISVEPEPHRRFRAVTLVEGLLLTQSMAVPGVSARGITRSTLSAGGPDVLNGILQQLGWPSRVLLEPWIEQDQQSRPTAAIVLPDVRAPSPDAALATMRNTVDQMVLLLTLYRQALPSLVATVVEAFDDDLRSWQPVGLLQHGPRYTGNMLGGSMSGEDRRRLLADWRALNGYEGPVRLWLRLFVEARNESSFDFKMFRLFELVETIARERVPPGQPVLADDGTQLTAGRQPATTSKARGLVYQLLAEATVNQSGFLPSGCRDLWQAVGVWQAFRDATTHYGGYRPDDALQQAQWWHGLIGDVLAVGGASGMDPRNEHEFALERLVVDVLYGELGHL